MEIRNNDSIDNDQQIQNENEEEEEEEEEEEIKEEEDKDLIQYDDIEIDDDELEAELNALDTNSIDIRPTKNNGFKLKETVNQVFNSFENVEIEWKLDEENKKFDSMLYADMSNGHFIFRDHFISKSSTFSMMTFSYAAFQAFYHPLPME